MLRAQQPQIAGAAALVLRLNQGEAVRRRALGGGLRRERLCVGLERVQGIRHVLKCGDDGGLIVGGRLLGRGNSSPALVHQLSTLENRLRDGAEETVYV